MLGPRWGGSGRPWSDSFGKLGSNLRGDPAALRPGNREGCTERKEQEVSHISTVSPGPLKGEKELCPPDLQCQAPLPIIPACQGHVSPLPSMVHQEQVSLSRKKLGTLQCRIFCVPRGG